MDNEHVTDLTYLNEVSKGDESFIREMIGVFLKEVPVEINNLESAVSRRDFDTIKAIAHKLKSSVPFVGIDKIIRDDLLEIERLALEGQDIQKIRTLFKKVNEICERACEELLNQKV